MDEDGCMDLSAEAAKPLKYTYTARINYIPGEAWQPANTRSKTAIAQGAPGRSIRRDKAFQRGLALL